MLKHIHLILLSLILSLSLTGCLGKNAAEDALSKVSNAPIAPEIALQVSKNVTNGALAIAGGIIQSKPMAQLSALFDGRLFSGTESFSAQTLSEADQESFQQNVEKIILFLMKDQTPLADGWKKLTPTAEFCSEIVGNPSDHVCLSIMEHVNFKAHLTGAHEGEVKILFDTTELATLSFSASSLSGEVKLAGIPTLLALIPDAPTFSSVTGALSASISRSGEQINIQYSASQAVNVVGDAQGTAIHIQVPQGGSLSVVHHHDLASTEVAANLGALNVEIGTVHVQVHESAQGSVVFNNASDHFLLQGLTLSGEGLEVTDNGSLVFHAKLASLTGDLEFHSDGFTVSHSSALNIWVELSEGSTQWEQAAGGQISVHGSNPPQVLNQDLTMHNSGNFGSGSMSIPANSCYGGMPWAIVSCS